MKINLFAKSLMLILAVALAGCSSNEDPEYITSELVSLSCLHEAIAKSSKQNFEKDNLPVWLTEFIHSLKPDNGRDVAAFQTKWKGEVVYYVYDEYFSCIACATFKSDGEKLDWSDNDFYELWESPLNWEIIYLSKSKIHAILYACGLKDHTRSETEGETILFSEDDIVSFNVTTREIKFKDMEPPLYQRLKPFHEIEFHLGDETLFTVSSFVGLWDSRIFEDIVLCWGNQENIALDGYYLYDCYPFGLDTESVRANREKNKAQWKTFINYLASKGKLTK